MPSAYNIALAENIAQAGADLGISSRRDIERRLAAKSKTFRPSYTALQRIADGTRPLRVFELAALARTFGVDATDLLPDASRAPNSSLVRKATLDLTVEQIVGLAHILNLDEAELLQQVAAATHTVAARSAAAQRSKETKQRNQETLDQD